MQDDDDDDNLRAAIAASLEQPQPEPVPAPPSAAQQSGNPEVLAGFSTRFRCYAAAAVGRKDIDATGKILLPQSALHMLLDKLPEMPSTLLLRLSHEGSAAYVGVAEFVEDAEASALLTRVAGQAVRNDALPRLFRGGPLAVCFVPRWVRAALLLEPSQPELSCHVVSLPDGTVRRVVLAAVALATHGSRRPCTRARRPAGLQRRAWATRAPQCRPGLPHRGTAPRRPSLFPRRLSPKAPLPQDASFAAFGHAGRWRWRCDCSRETRASPRRWRAGATCARR